MTQAPKKSKSISNHTIENYIQRVTELTQSAQGHPYKHLQQQVLKKLKLLKNNLKITSLERRGILS